jgi:UDP-glucose 4-epimerase
LTAARGRLGEDESMDQRKQVLLTGAAGLIGSHLREHWGDRYRLRLADVRPVNSLRAQEEYLSLDIRNPEAFCAAAEGMDTVVHLAADPSMEAEFFASLLDLNIIGAYHAFEAARRGGCRRLVFASSINVVMGYRNQLDVPCDVPVWPVNVYGATKCWGEALARVYADRHGLSCICVRIGGARFRQTGAWDPDRKNGGISPRDQAELFTSAIEAPDHVRFKIVNGISFHRLSWMSLAEARQLGYEPQDGTMFPRIEDGPDDLAGSRRSGP